MTLKQIVYWHLVCLLFLSRNSTNALICCVFNIFSKVFYFLNVSNTYYFTVKSFLFFLFFFIIFIIIFIFFFNIFIFCFFIIIAFFFNLFFTFYFFFSIHLNIISLQLFQIINYF